MTSLRKASFVINCLIVIFTICAASGQQQTFNNEVCSTCFQQLQKVANDEYKKQESALNEKHGKDKKKSNEVSRSLILFSIFELIWSMFKPVAEIEPALVELTKYITTKNYNLTLNFQKNNSKDKKEKQKPPKEEEDCIPVEQLANLECEELEKIQEKVRNAKPVPEKVKNFIKDLLKKLPKLSIDVESSTEESGPIKQLLMIPVKIVMLPFNIVGAIAGGIGVVLQFFGQTFVNIFVILGEIIVLLCQLLVNLLKLAIPICCIILLGAGLASDVQQAPARINRQVSPSRT